MPPAVRMRPSPAMTSVPGADDNINAGLCVGVARFADGMDQTVFQRDISLIDTGMINDQRVCDYRIDRTTGAGDLGLAHAVADYLAAAEFHFFAIGGQIALNLDHQIGVSKAEFIARGRAIHRGVIARGKSQRALQVSHDLLALKPKMLAARLLTRDQLHFAALARFKADSGA